MNGFLTVWHMRFKTYRRGLLMPLALLLLMTAPPASAQEEAPAPVDPRFGVERRRRLEGHKGQQLQHVVLHHVAHHANPVIEPVSYTHLDVYKRQLLEQLTGPTGNWVRVGDPNQAITSTFTAAHPRFFSRFIDRPDVADRTLPNSGRSARLIIGAANALLNWTIDNHPVPEVRSDAFRRQDILPAPPGDTQPNPPDSEAEMRIRVYRHREEEELPAVARLAWELSLIHILKPPR